MKPKYEWADHADARKFTKLVSKQCDVCQSCSAIPKWKIGMEPTLVPPALMASVALDLFHVKPVSTEEGTFDLFVLCVDRLSGWIIAEPGTARGLSGEWAAKKCTNSGECSDSPVWSHQTSARNLYPAGGKQCAHC